MDRDTHKGTKDVGGENRKGKKVRQRRGQEGEVKQERAGRKEGKADKRMQNKRGPMCVWVGLTESKHNSPIFTTQPLSLPQQRIVFPHPCRSLFPTIQASPNPYQTSWTLRADRIITSVTQAETWHLKMGWNYAFFFFFRGSVGGENFKLFGVQASQLPPLPPPLSLLVSPSVCLSCSVFSWKW